MNRLVYDTLVPLYVTGSSYRKSHYRKSTVKSLRKLSTFSASSDHDKRTRNFSFDVKRQQMALA